MARRFSLKLEDNATTRLRAFPATFRKHMNRELMRFAPEFRAELKRRVPRVTGTLGNSAVAKRRGTNGLIIGYTAHYAVFVYYRRPRFRSRTVRQTLAKYGRSRHLRNAMKEAGRRALIAASRELRLTVNR